MMLPSPGDGEHRIGKYRLIETLGSGGFATVYLAEDLWLSKEVALKVPHDQDAELVQKLGESRILASLDHPNIVTIFTADMSDLLWRAPDETEFHRQASDTFFVVMEYVDGRPLSEAIREEGPFGADDTLAIAVQAARALKHAHGCDVLHRDLKPSNILMRSDGRVKIADFGTSRILRDITHAPTRIGSPPYMAPEQFKGRATFQSDLYSFGVIMYEMTTGRVPVNGVDPSEIERRVVAADYKSPREHRPEVPEELDRFIMRMLSPHSRERPRSARSLLRTLEHLTGAADSISPQTSGGRMRPLESDERPRAKKTSGPRRQSTSAGTCWNCGRLLSKRAAICPHCHEEQT